MPIHHIHRVTPPRPISRAGAGHTLPRQTVSTDGQGGPLGPATAPRSAIGMGSLLNVWPHCSCKLVCDSNCPVRPLSLAVPLYAGRTQPPLIRSGSKGLLGWGRWCTLAGRLRQHHPCLRRVWDGGGERRRRASQTGL